jgi:hypothetical protein
VIVGALVSAAGADTVAVGGSEESVAVSENGAVRRRAAIADRQRARASIRKEKRWGGVMSVCKAFDGFGDWNQAE